MFVKSNIVSYQLFDYNIIMCISNDKLENIWFEVMNNNTKFMVGGVYRHPIQSIDYVIIN
jgi:hypothetical protein